VLRGAAGESERGEGLKYWSSGLR